MDYKELAEELEKMLPEKIPYGEFVGAPWPYTGQGEMVYEEPELYFIEQAATAITELLEEVERVKAERLTALSALRPVSREQVEKVWRGEWTEETYTTQSERGRVIRNIKNTCSACGKTNGRTKTNFCPSCGAPMTDKAVEMVMKRLEEAFSE